MNSDEPPKREKSSKATTVVIGITSAVLIASIIAWLSIGEPNLVYVDDLPRTPDIVKLVERNDDRVIDIQMKLWFRNWGLKSGHIEKVEVVPVELNPYPENVEVLYVDKTDIGFLRKRAVVCEFIVAFDPRAAHYKNNQAEFKAHFYGSAGNEITRQIARLYLKFPN